MDTKSITDPMIGSHSGEMNVKYLEHSIFQEMYESGVGIIILGQPRMSSITPGRFFMGDPIIGPIFDLLTRSWGGQRSAPKRAQGRNVYLGGGRGSWPHLIHVLLALGVPHAVENLWQ